MPYKVKEKRNEWFRNKMRQQRLDPLYRQQEALRARQRRGQIQEAQICEICGYSQVTDVHHEKDTTHILCPNCHALITRGIKTMDELKGITQPDVQPINLNDIEGELPSVIPKPEDVHPNTVIPKQHCRLPFCVICDPEREQEWFKKTFGDYDWLNMAGSSH